MKHLEMTEILVPEAVRVASSVSSKKRLLQDIADHANSVYGLSSAQVFSALQDRENLGTTGVGRGVAIPHARFDSVDKIVGVFYRIEKPVNFESLDRQPVDLVFTLLAPSNDSPEHLKALALVSRTLRSDDLCGKLRANSSVASIYSMLTDTARSQAA